MEDLEIRNYQFFTFFDFFNVNLSKGPSYGMCHYNLIEKIIEMQSWPCMIMQSRKEGSFCHIICNFDVVLMGVGVIFCKFVDINMVQD